MKKLIILLAIIYTVASCENRLEEGYGLGELKLGTTFASLPIFKKFEKILDDEYFLQEFKISDEIGNVSNVVVTTQNGKITEVTFSSTKETNIAELDNRYSQLIEQKFDTVTRIKMLRLPKTKYYITADSLAMACVTYQKETRRKGTFENEYYYISKDAAMKKIVKTRKELGIK